MYLVSYDIVNDRRRVKAAKALEDYGVRVQYSVFECLIDEQRLSQLIARLEAVINAEEDGVRVYTLCAACSGKVAIKGVGRITKDEDVYIV
jgi:CRISPR-associated protein Cas2